MNLLSENQNIDHDQLIKLATEAVTKFKQANQLKLAQQAANPAPNPNQLIKPGNYRTVPCRNFHGPTGCTRGDFCHFIHATGYELRELPREVFQNIRNQNIRLNYLTEIGKVLPKQQQELQNQPMAVIQQFVNTHNAKLMSDPAFAQMQMAAGAMPHMQ